MSQVGLANVYDLCWSESLLAKMECAVPFFPRYYLSLERLFPSPSFESAEFNRWAISLPQQTGQETIISTYSLSCNRSSANKGGRYGLFFASPAHAMRADLFTSLREDNTMHIAP